MNCAETANINRMDSVSSLQQAWELIFNCEPPDNAQFSLWLIKHDLPVIRKAIGTTAMKYKKLEGGMTREHLIKFTSAVANRLEANSYDALGVHTGGRQ